MKELLKNLCLIFVATGTLFLIACNEDGDGNPKYDFKDQNLQGMIDGIEFNLGGGIVETSGEELSFDLYSDLETEAGCDIFGFGAFVQVFFTIPNETGVLELFINFSSGEGETVTMFNPDGSVNIIASEGAVEIISITETTVTGRLDIKFDGENFINGNFTAEFCE